MRVTYQNGEPSVIVVELTERQLQKLNAFVKDHPHDDFPTDILVMPPQERNRLVLEFASRRVDTESRAVIGELQDKQERFGQMGLRLLVRSGFKGKLGPLSFRIGRNSNYYLGPARTDS